MNSCTVLICPILAVLNENEGRNTQLTGIDKTKQLHEIACAHEVSNAALKSYATARRSLCRVTGITKKSTDAAVQRAFPVRDQRVVGRVVR